MLEDEEDPIDTEQLKRIWNKLDYKDMVIIGMALLMLLMYIYHTSELDRCIYYFNDLIRNMSITQYPLFS